VQVLMTLVVLNCLKISLVILSVCYSMSALSKEAIQLQLPLEVNNAFVGDIDAFILETDYDGKTQSQIEVPRIRLRALLSELADEEQLVSWFSTEDGPRIKLKTLRLNGLQIDFDAGLLTIMVSFRRLGVQSLSLRSRNKPIVNTHFTQAEIASGLNVNVSDDYHHDVVGSTNKGFQNTVVDFSGFTTVGGFDGWSLFYEGEYSKNEISNFARKDIKLIHDDYATGLRYILGDIRPTISRFQSSLDLLGLGIERNYVEINPFRNLRPSGRSNFTLENDANVTFEVNGAIVSTERLQAGSYSIRDFPLANGGNDVSVWVDDGNGEIEIATFSSYVDTALLAENITNFGANIGVLRDVGVARGRRYFDAPVLMGFYETGLNSNLTLAAQLELSEDHNLLSSSAIYGSRLGVVALEAAASKRKNGDTGFAALLRYDYGATTKSDWFVQNDLQYEYRSDSFISLGSLSPGVREWSLNARTSLSKNDISLTFSAEKQAIEDTVSKYFTASLSKSFAGWGVSLSYQRNQRDISSNDNRFNLTVSKRIGGSKLRSQYTSRLQEFKSEWRTGLSKDTGDLSARVAKLTNDSLDEIELDASYIASRYELDLRHKTSNVKRNIVADLSTTSVSWSTSMGYADGLFSFGRPFNRGFMIVDRHNNLHAKKVSVMRGSERSGVVTEFEKSNTALVPINSSYRTQRFFFEVDDLPVGYDLGAGSVKVYPGHLAGFRYSLGSDAANTIIGTVAWPDGSRLSLLSGRLQSLDNNTEQPIFTNRSGRFVAEKLTVGRYRILFGVDDEFFAEFEVLKKGEPGLVQIGDIILKRLQ